MEKACALPTPELSIRQEKRESQKFTTEETERPADQLKCARVDCSTDVGRR